MTSTHTFDPYEYVEHAYSAAFGRQAWRDLDPADHKWLAEATTNAWANGADTYEAAAEQAVTAFTLHVEEAAAEAYHARYVAAYEADQARLRDDSAEAHAARLYEALLDLTNHPSSKAAREHASNVLRAYEASERADTRPVIAKAMQAARGVDDALGAANVIAAESHLQDLFDALQALGE